jgi:hypothetical protein
MSSNVSQAHASLDSDVTTVSNVSVARKMLCKPVSYATVQNIVCTEDFVTDQLTFSMRLLCSSADLSVVYNWLPWEYTRFMKKEAHIEHLKDIYAQVAESSSSQSFMVLINNTNIAQADVYEAMADDISLQYDAKQGDYRLQLLIKPEKLIIGNYAACIMQTVMEFFFSFREVKRLMIQLDEHEFLNTKAEKVGFVFLKKLITRQKTARLYTCTRENFMQVRNKLQ